MEFLLKGFQIHNINNSRIILFTFLMFCMPAAFAAAPSGPELVGPLETLFSKGIFTLFFVIYAGLLFGKVNVKGLSLGSSGVIFVALVVGHFGYTIPAGTGVIGIVLFICAVGLTAGPGFFSVFKSDGKKIVYLAIILAVTSSVVAYICGVMSGVPPAIVVGLWAGAITSTPALAGASGAYAGNPDALALVAVGYGIAYIFGVVMVVFFVQLLPRILRKDLDALAIELKGPDKEEATIKQQIVRITNPNVCTHKIADSKIIEESHGRITRVAEGNRLVHIPKDYTLKIDDRVLISCLSRHEEIVLAMFGEEGGNIHDYLFDVTNERMRIVVTSKNVIGRSIADLKLLPNYGLMVARIIRHEVEFIVDSDTCIQLGDILLAVGEEADLSRFAIFAGHRSKAVDDTNLSSLSLLLMVGIAFGSVLFSLGNAGISLGVAGGVMIFSLLVGHFGQIGQIYASVPRATRVLMMDLGLVFFLASAGINAGGSIVSVMMEYGYKLPLIAIIIAVVPIVVGVLFAMKVLKLNFLQVLGGICGGVTSTPGLGAVTSKVDSDIPLISYAAAYPVSLIFMMILGPLLVSLLIM